MRYRSVEVESVRDYLLVDSCTIRAELYSRTETNQWTLTEILDSTGMITLSNMNTTLRMTELYEDVQLA